MEKDIEQYLRREIKKKGGLALKFISPGYRGVMDRILLIHGGIVIFVETKDTGKDLKKLQAAVRRKFEALGMRVEKIDSKEQAKQLIDEVYPS